MILIYIYLYINILPYSMFYVCVFYMFFSSKLYLYNTALSVLVCVNNDVIMMIMRLQKLTHCST